MKTSGLYWHPNNRWRIVILPENTAEIFPGVFSCTNFSTKYFDKFLFFLSDDTPADGCHDDTHQRTKQVEETIGEIGEGGDTQNR